MIEKPKKGSCGVGFLERLSKRGKKVVTQPFRSTAGPSWREYYGTSPPTLPSTDPKIEASKLNNWTEVTQLDSTGGKSHRNRTKEHSTFLPRTVRLQPAPWADGGPAGQRHGTGPRARGRTGASGEGWVLSDVITLLLGNSQGKWQLHCQREVSKTEEQF